MTEGYIAGNDRIDREWMHAGISASPTTRTAPGSQRAAALLEDYPARVVHEIRDQE